MRKIIFSLFLVCASMICSTRANAQATELAQLALNIEKLAQFKSILSDLKKGYDIVFKGYNTIKDLSQGNFSLHKTFLDGLLEVNPLVKKYHKVVGIIDLQITLVNEYKSAFTHFKEGNMFTPEEINYMGNVYNKLFKSSLKNLDQLTNVITAGNLRMSDDERMQAIDKIYADMEDKILFLRSFNDDSKILALSRAKEKNDVEGVKSIFGINIK